MTEKEIIKAICEIKDTQVLGKIAHKTMVRACQLEESLEIDSDSKFENNGKLFLKTSMHFEMEIIKEEEPPLTLQGDVAIGPARVGALKY